MTHESATHEDSLRRTALFRDLDAAALRELGDAFVELQIPKDAYLFLEDDPTDAFYVVAQGAVILVRDTVGRPMQLITRLGEGDFCGLAGLFDTVKHSTSAKAVEPCRVLKIDKKCFLEFIGRHAALAVEIQMKAAERHRIYAAAALDLGRRSEVRIRIDRPARILAPAPILDPAAAEKPIEVRIDNISSGGLCFAAIPAAWNLDDEIDLRLEVRGTTPLEMRARVAWIRENRLGVAFLAGATEPKLQVERLLHELLILK